VTAQMKLNLGIVGCGDIAGTRLFLRD